MRKTLTFCLLSGILALAGPAWSQAADALERLDQLSPAERQALLDAISQTDMAQSRNVGEPPLSQPPADPSLRPTRSDDGDSTNAGRYPRLDDLKPFGYELFAGEPTTFAPATDIPVPVDYIIGPGDTVDVQLFGGESASYRLVVGRDGILNVPEIGPVAVAGLTFDNMQALLRERISEQKIGVRASITMGPLRSIRVFVLGDAYRPGSYTVSSLSTMTNALFVSGGINSIGSLRNVQLKRGGNTVTTLDLYDLLLRGDTSSDARLQPGDVIFVPPVGKTVGIGGEVRRPAIYELRNESSIREVVRLAGGMLPSAFPEASQVSRINDNRDRTIINVDLTTDTGMSTRVRAEDLISVFSVLDKREDIVTLQGHVYRPGPRQWIDGMTLTDLLPSVNELRPQADLEYVLIRRVDTGNQSISVLSANLADAHSGISDVRLKPLDQVTVFSKEGDRGVYIDNVLTELRLQARRAQPMPEVQITGRVAAPGRYPLEAGMRVADLIRAGGSLLESAYDLEAELTRYTVDSSQQLQSELVSVNLAAAISGNEQANLPLSPRDVLNIKEIPLWRDTESISIEGEVVFPGDYTIRRGERLSSVLARAGGLTDLAFPDGAIFLREELREREQAQIRELESRLEAEIKAIAASDPESDVSSQLALLDQVRRTEATGRLVIDLGAIALGNHEQLIDVSLRGGDRLMIPREPQTVTIIGEVQFPTSHIFEPGVSRDQYINRSGGTTALADEKRIYVVRANGSVEASRRSLFFRPRDLDDIRPGDTIVVPLKPDQTSTFLKWAGVTTIIYNIGVSAAAIASFL